ncbi:MAG: efflux RND transporter periplasmic adaptor subunit [Cyanobacteria bacterium P01_H01_bin.58]
MTSPELSSASETMQPIMASERSVSPSRWLLITSLGVLLLGGGVLIWWLMQPRGGPPFGFPPAAVELTSVQSGPVLDSSEFLGSLEAQTGVVLQPEVSGRVAQVFVAAGDRVEPGTPILLISPDRTQAEANAAQAQVDAAQAQVDAAQSREDAFRAGVSAAEAARTSAAASLRSLEARQTELEAELVLQEEEYRRTATLVEQGALSQQSLDIASRNLEVAQANLTSVKEEILAAEATLAQSAAALTEARATLAESGASVTQSEASRAQAIANRSAVQENLQDRTVVAPITGIVGDLNIKLGDYVTPSTVITNITENSTLELDLEVPIDERDRLELGLPVELVNTDATGSIIFISPQANPDTQTVLVKARFSNLQGLLQDAQRVEARIIWAETTGLLVPTSAITRIGGQTFVYVAVDAPAATEGEVAESPAPAEAPAPGQVAQLRLVELGEIQDNSYQVLSGLEPGEAIVTSGILNLQDGAPIQESSTESTE